MIYTYQTSVYGIFNGEGEGGVQGEEEENAPTRYYMGSNRVHADGEKTKTVRE